MRLGCQYGATVGLPRPPSGADELGKQEGPAQMPAQGNLSSAPGFGGCSQPSLPQSSDSHRGRVEIHLPSSFPGTLRGWKTQEQMHAFLCSVHGPEDVHVQTDELFQASQNAIISFSFPFRIVDV